MSALGLVAGTLLALSPLSMSTSAVPGVINGSEGTAAEFPEVVRLRGGKVLCTATLVGPRALLTAAHCAVVGGATFSYRGETYRVRFVVSPYARTRAHDLAVAIADRPVEGAAFATVGGDVSPDVEVMLLGFGCSRQGRRDRAGLLRVGATRVVGHNGPLFLTRGGGAVCFGDSGGPTFVQQGTRRLLVGVHSRGNIRDANLDVRLSSKLSRSFLSAVARKHRLVLCGVTDACGQQLTAPVPLRARPTRV